MISIQAVRLTLGAVLKWTFSKLPGGSVGRGGHGVGVTRVCRGQVATDCQNVRSSTLECVLFHRMFLKSVIPKTATHSQALHC